MTILVLQSSLLGKKELFALLNLSSWRLVIVVRLFLAVPLVCLQFVFVVFLDHTHYFSSYQQAKCDRVIREIGVRYLVKCHFLGMEIILEFVFYTKPDVFPIVRAAL